MNNGDVVQVRHTSSEKFSSNMSTTVDIGGVSGSFISTTIKADTVPDFFNLINQEDVPLLQSLNLIPLL